MVHDVSGSTHIGLVRNRRRHRHRKEEAKINSIGLELVDDIRLQAVCIESEKIIHGSQEDEAAAMKSLSAVKLDDKQLKETVISFFMAKFSKLSEGAAEELVLRSASKTIHTPHIGSL
ncbi:hypothetical protein RIF29_09925 [Crotalaria pallida]|uniref:Uncharacterized protein n=1 Tax=Crotalaria pallida TaxID=3830 RepID=A0AAN9IJM9_CROPI